MKATETYTATMTFETLLNLLIATTGPASVLIADCETPDADGFTVTPASVARFHARSMLCTMVIDNRDLARKLADAYLAA